MSRRSRKFGFRSLRIRPQPGDEDLADQPLLAQCNGERRGSGYPQGRRCLSDPHIRRRPAEHRPERSRGLELITGSNPAIVDWMAKMRLNVAWPPAYRRGRCRKINNNAP